MPPIRFLPPRPLSGRAILSAGLAGGTCFTGLANGVDRNGSGARAMALAGADAALADTPLSALAANPAGLGGQDGTRLELGLVGGVPGGDFSNAANVDAPLSRSLGALPEFAVAFPAGVPRLGLGVSFTPDALLAARWHYADAPGGLSGGTSYGDLIHRSEILSARSALAAGFAVNEWLAVGGSIGLLYNRNELETAYVFQSHPVLRGFKTLVDLDTDGLGVDGEFGVLLTASDRLKLAVTYKTPSRVEAEGTLTGNAGAELTALGPPFSTLPPSFAYDAEVETTFPQQVTAGVAWQAAPEWRLLAQVDWVHWSDAFDDLPLRLRNGTNAGLNAILGSDALDDSIPLRWQDRLVYRAGVEYAPGRHWAFRAGYSFGDSPVPDGTLTPLTAAIMEHTVGAGAGYRWRRWQVDAAWQWDLPANRRVGTSDLLAGEYSGSSVTVDVQWFGLTVGFAF
ncbi:MAG: OmpP1/FadL family transporter [Limisphaerales bacterium]